MIGGRDSSSASSSTGDADEAEGEDDADGDEDEETGKGTTMTTLSSATSLVISDFSNVLASEDEPPLKKRKI